jgi:hypothetical protein
VWYAHFDAQEHYALLKSLRFQPCFATMTDQLIARHSLPLTNMVHLRIEDDLKIFGDNSAESAVARYQQLLKDHFLATDTIVTLSGSERHVDDRLRGLTSVVKAAELQALGLNGGNVNAILDLHLGLRCTGTLLGNFDVTSSRGSTFSFYLAAMLERCTLVLASMNSSVPTQVLIGPSWRRVYGR